MAKEHSNTIDFHKNLLEELGYRCKRELDLPIPELGTIHKIDIACFGKCLRPIAAEFDGHMESPQAISNTQDLERFKKLFPNSRTFHLSTSELIKREDLQDINDCTEEIKEEKLETPPGVILKKKELPKGWLGPFDLNKK